MGRDFFVQLPLPSGDQPGAALEGEIGPDPLQNHKKPVRKAGKIVDMDQQPGQPGKHAGKGDPPELPYRAALADDNDLLC